MKLRDLALALVLVPTAACSKKPEPPPPTTAPAPGPATAPKTEADAAPAPTAAAPTDAAVAPTTAVASDAATPASEADASAAACGGATIALDLDGLAKEFADAHAAFERGDWKTAPKDDSSPPGVDAAKVPKVAPLVARLGFGDAAKDLEVTGASSAFDVYDCAFAKRELASEPGQRDVLVSVSCQNDSFADLMDGTTQHFGAVLRPLAAPTGSYCVIGQLTAHDALSGRPCIGDYEGKPQWELTPVELVAAGREAVREDWRGGMCGDGTERGNDVRVAFHGVEGGKLVRYFGGTLDETSYQSPCPPTSGTVGKVTLGDAFPKVITFEREAVCEAPMEGCEAEPCKAQKGTETWVYKDGAYAREGAPALADDGGAVEPTTAAGYVARAREASKARRYADAVADFQKAFALEPELPKLRGELGWALFNAGQLADARAITEAALANAEKAGSKGALLYNLGRIDEAEGKREDAIAHYKASLAARPENDIVQKRLDALLAAPK